MTKITQQEKLPLIEITCAHCHDTYKEGHSCARTSNLEKLMKIPLSPDMENIIKIKDKNEKS